MHPRGRVVGAVLTLGLSVAMTGIPALSAAAPAAAATAAVPPACATADLNPQCIHAPTPDVTALPAPAITTTYDLKTHARTVFFTAAITAPYHACPGGDGVPYADIPCSFDGLGVTGRVYQPGVGVPVFGSTQILGDGTCATTCPVSITFGANYHGPATIILHFSLGELIIADNDLFTSSYETTIALPEDPVTDLFHLSRPKVVFSGAVKSTTVHLAGDGGIPASGVGGVLVRISGPGIAILQNGNYVGNNSSSLYLVPGTKLTLKRDYPGSLTVVSLGYYSGLPETTGSLWHASAYAYRMRVAPTIRLASAHVPLDATAAVLDVLTPKGPATLGGVAIPKEAEGQFVVAPLKPGAVLTVKAPKGTKIDVFGYTEPPQPIDDGYVLAPTTVDPLEGMLGLPDPFS